LAQPGEYSDILRALGRFLDDVQAFGVEVIDQGETWAVSWDRPGTIYLQHFELEALRQVARMNRGLEGDMPRLTTAQMFRVLGSILDETRATSFSISETDDGYRLTHTTDGKETVHTLSLDDIRTLWTDRMSSR
jgi:hypothetical protein